MFLPREGLSAERTLVRCFTSVKMHVVREVLLTRKRLRAVRAFEWSFAGMLSVTSKYIHIFKYNFNFYTLYVDMQEKKCVQKFDII